MIKFSVLIPVYKSEKPQYLQEALESVINQTKKPSEIVIVEDGKLTDELEKVINKVKNSNYNIKIKVIKIEKNIGVGGALSKGIKECEYDYIARLDSDDIALKNRFELQTRFFEENPEVDILSGYIKEFWNNVPNESGYIRKVPTTDEEIKKYMKYRSPLNHSAVMYKKKSILKIGNYNNLRVMEDYDLWIRAANKGLNMRNIPQVILNVRVGKDTYKKRGGIKYIKNIVRIENTLKNNNIINNREKIRNIFTRSIVAITPWWIRKQIYLKYLRRSIADKNEKNSSHNECI